MPTCIDPENQSFDPAVSHFEASTAAPCVEAALDDATLPVSTIGHATAATATVVGLRPLYPWPFTASRWWTEPVRAERLAAFRIALALVLMVDVCCLYWPVREQILGSASLGSPEVFASRLQPPFWNWSLLSGVTDPGWLSAALVVWGVAALLLAVGCWARPAALVAWVLTISVMNVNYFIHNGGDRLRLMGLFYLILTPCAAAWSCDAWRRNKDSSAGPRFVDPWALRLMFLQLTAMYFFSGVLKEKGDTWNTGQALYLVITNVAWTRWSYQDLAMPGWCAEALTWLTLVWEIGFPLLVLYRPTRTVTLLFGAAFHVATGLLLKLGLFPVYALCWYVPLLPWERLADRWQATRATKARPQMG